LTVALVLGGVLVTTIVVKRQPPPEQNTVSTVEVANKDNLSPVKAPTPDTSPAVSTTTPSDPGVQQESKPRQTTATARAPQVLRRLEEKTPEQLVREAERKYLAAIGILSRDVKQLNTEIDEPTRMKFEQALASIDRTIDATRKAVREHPSDPVAVQYMLAAYARKVDVLREMAGRGAF
jgi:hypothetical protein